MRFVSVDDLEATFQAGPDADGSFAALVRAFETAAALRGAGLEFVVAPLADDEGRVVRRLDRRYAVTVLPFVEGRSSEWGAYETAEGRRRAAALLARLHAAPVERTLPRRDDLTIPSRAQLEAALAHPGRPWREGPLGEPARRALAPRAADLARRLAGYDLLAARVRAGERTWVVTHGEPHRANLIEDATGALHLVDWDTTLLAPRERDLGFVLDDALTGWDEYAAAAGDVVLDRDALRLYREWWALADVAVFVAAVRRPHEETEDTRAFLRALRETLG